VSAEEENSGAVAAGVGVVGDTLIGPRQNHIEDICPSIAAMHLAGRSMAEGDVRVLGHGTELHLVAAHMKLNAGNVAKAAVREGLDYLLHWWKIPEAVL